MTATILIVEDEFLIGIDMQMMLEDAGIRTIGPIATLQPPVVPLAVVPCSRLARCYIAPCSQTWDHGLVESCMLWRPVPGGACPSQMTGLHRNGRITACWRRGSGDYS